MTKREAIFSSLGAFFCVYIFANYGLLTGFAWMVATAGSLALVLLATSVVFKWTTKLKPLEWYRRKQRRALHAHLPHPWNLLGATGNGVGDAPFSFARMHDISFEDFEDFVWGELYDNFWHQGTIYAATPFAVQACIEHMNALELERQDMLGEFFAQCLQSEEIGPCDGMQSGVWISKYDQQLLREAGIVRPTVKEVLRVLESRENPSRAS